MPQTVPTPVADALAAGLAEAFLRVRQRSLALVEPLAPEDTVVQSMPDVSPTKWHLAHTTWFFEQFLLGAADGYRPWREEWLYLFNSYYESVGPMHARLERGLLSRPTLHEVLEYRRAVDERVCERLERGVDEALATVLTLGLNHEQQHQELMLTDIKHVLSRNPLQPAYRDDLPVARRAAPAQGFIAGREGIVAIGHDPADGFGFDCETPRHRQLLQPHALARRPVTNAEYREFIADGGYRTATLWMSEGWATLNTERWCGPLYWDEAGETEFTLGGRREIDPDAPVSHVSFYEADAYARWTGLRLPTEGEWESAAAGADPDTGNFQDGDGPLHPQAARSDDGEFVQLFGDVWEWTGSPYVNYPGFRTLPGALGEYNGKFMCGQYVLRGGSCASPRGHLRPSYRNFFYPRDRWQFTGIRLARDA